MYSELRSIESVARVYARYDLAGIAYCLLQPYSMEALEGLEEIAMNVMALLAAIRDLVRTLPVDTTGTVEEVSASLDSDSVAAAVAALAAPLPDCQAFACVVLYTFSQN